MKTFNIEVIERNSFCFEITAETEKEARNIVKNSWNHVSEENNDCLKSSDIDILVFTKYTK